MATLLFHRALLVATFVLVPAALGATAPGSIPVPVLPDVTVVTESGAKVPFRELVEGRMVAVNFIFTSCPTVCRLMGANFGQLQKVLGKRHVSLISISIDPETDTPARLAEWSKRFGAQPGWTLVTGATADIDLLQKAFGVFSSDPFAHSPSMFVADTRRGLWRRVDGLAPPSTIIHVIDSVSAERTR